MKKKNHILLTALLSVLFLSPFALIFLRSLDAQAVYQVYLAEPAYLLRFWRSLALTLVIALGQTAISILAGYSFAKYDFPGKRALGFALLLMMVLPIQVTLIPGYMTLRQLNLLNTYYAMALPMVFVPLGTFLLSRSFRAVPEELIGAARLDGCGTLGAIFRIAVPAARSGVISVFILSFLDAWNMVEQPIAYVDNTSMYPLSVYLALSPAAVTTVRFVCVVLASLPPVLLLLSVSQEMNECIGVGGTK